MNCPKCRNKPIFKDDLMLMYGEAEYNEVFNQQPSGYSGIKKTSTSYFGSEEKKKFDASGYYKEAVCTYCGRHTDCLPEFKCSDSHWCKICLKR
jgi:hypothetical protein